MEGYFDVIELHAAGVENVVGVLGTALSSEQIESMARLLDSKVNTF